MKGNWDLYKIFVGFECKEGCLEKCKNNSLFRYYNGSDESDKWSDGSDIQFRCKTGYKRIIDLFNVFPYSISDYDVFYLCFSR